MFECVVNGRLIMWSVGFRDAASGWHAFVLEAGKCRDVATDLPSYEEAVAAGVEWTKSVNGIGQQKATDAQIRFWGHAADCVMWRDRVNCDCGIVVPPRPTCARKGCGLPERYHPHRSNGETRRHDFIASSIFVECDALRTVGGIKCTLPAGHRFWHQADGKAWRLAQANARSAR